MNCIPAGIGLAGALLTAATAVAQTPPPATPAPAAKPAPAAGPPPAPAPTTVQGLVVRAEDAPMKSSIDRRSYSVEGDLQATTGSIADALKRVPSVEVDIDGNVKLRGDSSVTILIDGRPSSLMKGAGRADALQALPADQIERVEVLTNPGAQYSPEGTGGVINLVTKKSRRSGAGASGSVRADAGTGGRYKGGLNLAYKSKALTLSANAGFWTFDTRFDNLDDRTLGGGLRRRSDSTAQITGAGGNIRLAADYDLDSANQLSAELNVFGYRPDFEIATRYQTFDALGALTSLSGREGSSSNRTAATNLGLTWRREFKGEDHNFTLAFNRGFTTTDAGNEFRLYSTTPAGPDSYQANDGRNDEDSYDLQGDYSRPMPHDGRLKAGFDWQRDRNDADDAFSVGPTRAGLAFDPTRSHRLIFTETVVSAYLTYEQQIGDLTILPGLRYEGATDDLNLLTTGLMVSHGYDRLYPSLHLDYRLSDTSRLKASYSLRIARPTSRDLDPFRTYFDAFNYGQGNPGLEPSQTRSWEASYEYRKARNYYLLTGFWRQTEDGIVDQRVDLGGGVLLTTRANLARSRSGGIEFVVNRSLTRTISLNATGTTYWNRIDTVAGFGSDRSGWSVSGRTSVDWQPTPDDLFQINAVATSRWLTPQGHVDPTYSLNLGYRRRLGERWFLTVTATDIFDGLSARTVYDAPGLSGFSARNGATRRLSVGLRYRFGAGKPQRDPAFDYGGGQGGAGGPPN